MRQVQTSLFAIALAVCASAALSACSETKKAPAAATPAPVPSFTSGVPGTADLVAAEQQIVGNWSFCRQGGTAASATPGAVAILSLKLDYVFQAGKQLEIVSTRFTGPACNPGTEYDRSRIMASWAISGPSIVPGAFNLDYALQGERKTPLSQQAVQFFNGNGSSTRLWGLQWALGGEQDVTGRPMSPTTPNDILTPGTRYYTIAKVDAAQLLVGAQTATSPNGSTPELRHNALDFDIYRKF